MKEKKKKSGHSKPSQKKESYQNSMETLGIDIESYGPKQPKPIMVYKIHCHFRKTLDHSKYTWAKQELYSQDMYKYRFESDEICKRLESKYKNWIFSSIPSFVPIDSQTITGIKLPEQIIFDIENEEKKLMNKLNMNKIIKTTSPNIDSSQESQSVKKTKKRTSKNK